MIGMFENTELTLEIIKLQTFVVHNFNCPQEVEQLVMSNWDEKL